MNGFAVGIAVIPIGVFALWKFSARLCLVYLIGLICDVAFLIGFVSYSHGTGHGEAWYIVLLEFFVVSLKGIIIWWVFRFWQDLSQGKTPLDRFDGSVVRSHIS